ncbi:potassium-transporting ATPase, A subunit [Catenulispora acidiphila DSM 44928]|uniref:Potassium-transporting ATPase potassium-binding subunit n=1 Tax=Catenulispora acidiphila (strain DSM 44928 / JCM 14897 / NBRC 102108 / NRRL B-24433 / ID139908) TaxID=479433 RepID=C7Q1T1_CATAD|nr:potassium-transporting ATPase subunit KdpA [Catenulispora acidiphila]ACU75632.1 potassium-transporting ATPase, A subunit [Catenulispora acidiphila DSM 44928]
MSDTWAGVLQVAALVLMLAVSYRPLGDYMAHILTSRKHLRAELALYKTMGVDAEADQTWGTYLRSVFAISAVGILLLYLLLRVQHHLMTALGMPKMNADLAYNTAASFVTNTNWQNYGGENTLGYVAQVTGLAVQNFVSASVGIAVVATLIRGFTRNRTDRLGNFWVDLTRVLIRLMLPFSIVFAVILVAGGAVESLGNHLTVVHTINGDQNLYTGGTASQEVIKLLGTNGGGIFNANSAHPFENPTGFTNLVEIYLLLVIGFALPRTFGKMVGSHRQGYTILSVMAIIWIGSLAFSTFFEVHHHGIDLANGHAALEGKESRFGIPASTLFMTSTTLTSTGAVNSWHDSYTPFGGGAAMFNMMLGEIAPGGTGSGLYGMLILAIITVFIAGLMVGRTPEYLGKKIRPTEMKYAALYILTTPAVVLIFTGLAMALKGETASINSGNLGPGGAPAPHGFSEVLYAFTSMGNNNGSAFGGLSGNTHWWNTAGALAMMFGRFLPMIWVLALAGSLAKQKPVPETEGTLKTASPLFAGMLLGTVLLVVGLTYFPALSLGPLAEGLH